MRKHRLVIGVVGASRHMNRRSNTEREEILKLAREIGEETTARQKILLTGGKPDSGNERVRDCAMAGAKSRGTQAEPARLVSVLPTQNGSSIDVTPAFSVTCKHLIIQTDLTDARNFIVGRVPDVLIAVSGGIGTLSEIAFAYEVGTPIVFLHQRSGPVKTLNELRGLKREDLKTFLEGIHGTFRQFDPEVLSGKVLSFIHESTGLYTAESARDAVSEAIGVARPKVATSANCLPAYDGFTPEHIEKYTRYLDTLAD